MHQYKKKLITDRVKYYHYSRFPIPDSRFPIPDSRFPIPDSRFPIPDSRFPIPNSRYTQIKKRPPNGERFSQTQPIKPNLD
ncbi:hypothetical protein [Moorena producens]|uniref:hypothetical protein n=1 Tax=Moorena producens TaxID=1155739 RepID=UPI001313F083|nr:hypothetical protein [Moorena producens]